MYIALRIQTPWETFPCSDSQQIYVRLILVDPGKNFPYAPTMKQNISAESLKDYEKNLRPYYVKEIVPYAVERKLFKPIDKGRLGTSATHLGMGKIHAKTSTGKFIVEFLNKATIHGLNHIAAPRRHSFERFLTVLFVGVALACSVVSSLYYWDQYQKNPTSMMVDIRYENFNVTKPAMTVCLKDKVSADLFPEVFKKFGVEDTQEARDFFLFISSPAYATLNQTPIYNDTPPEKWLGILRDLYTNVEINKCSGYNPQCRDMNDTITDIVTEKGMCTTIYGSYAVYSSVDYWISDDWSVFPKNDLDVYTYMHRDARIKLHNIPGPYEESMAFHHPNEVPQSDDAWHDYLEPGQVDVIIDIQEVESSDDLRKLSQYQRPCNYPEDGKLEMWPVYTRNMCLLEIKYKFFKNKCGCYPHFARPMRQNARQPTISCLSHNGYEKDIPFAAGIPICNATQLRCIGNLQKVIAFSNAEKRNVHACPDSCDTTRYSRIFFAGRNFEFGRDLPQEERNRLVTIEAQFPFYKLRNEVFFGFNEFLISVGGAAGLFLGASIISFVEILYYVTLRLFWYMNYIHKQGR